MDTKVAVVTGSNKGVGFAIVRALCRQFDGDVYLTLFDKGLHGALSVHLCTSGCVYSKGDSIPFAEQAAATTRTNFFSTLDASCPLRLDWPGARKLLRARFTDSNLTMDELIALVNKFVETANVNKHLEAGFCGSSYFLSKIGVTVMSMIQQREIDSQGANDKEVNACCPGYVDTDLTNHQGSLTIDEGAETPVYCALLPPNINSPRGKFIREKKIADWIM